MARSETGYVDLVRGNVNFRRLWLGNVVSLFGDWFNTIALYSLVLSLSGSEFALGAVFITKMLPMALASPIAGLIVDRLDRRKVMIASDLLRAAIVLCFLFIDEPGKVYWVYVITAAQVTVASVFQPAQSSSIPNLVSRNELVTANTILSATWSILLTVGAAVGGMAADVLGLKAVFVIDSLTYLVSAWFIYRTTIPQHTTSMDFHSASGEKPSPVHLVQRATADVVAGWRRMRERPEVGRMALAKATWGLAGGGLVYMLTLMGEEISPERQAMAIGLLFAARGFGTGLGPVMARAWFRNMTSWPALMGFCMVFSGLAYAVAGNLTFTFWVILPVVLAHTTSGANWVLSTVLLQERSEDRFRGRIFATEWLLFFLVDAASILVASLVLEFSGLSLSLVVMGFATVQVLSGVWWLFWAVPAEKFGEVART
ncbi:MAG: MFS transporter [Bacteroidetes bacterium CG12_big_fil_rev_8_21_14_0_65_60_17]|nr:MAG: MFS transporter [Bacteroidetes bacterium CG12_big_fil_rev_8_21_14_0_65_60_17]